MNINTAKYFPRRKFIKAFISEVLSFNEEMHGIKNIPLNRINELPEEKIREIIPVIFKETDWKIGDDNSLQVNKKDGYRIYKYLDEVDLFVLQQIQTNTMLDSISKKLVDDHGLDSNEAFKRVSAFFFELVSLMICHPEQQYDFNQLSNLNSKNS